MLKKLITPTLALFATPLMAHPGHGAENSALHWFTSADHLALLGAAALLIVGGAYLMSKKLKAAKQRL